jgi:hypothetical protein
VSPEHGVVLWEGDRSFFDAAVEPGETTTICAGLWTPYDPGTYLLQWDLLVDQVNWFSERGVAPHEVTVLVTDADRLTDRRRPVAELPTARPNESSPTGSPAPTQAGRLARLRARAAALRTGTSSHTADRPGHPTVSGANVVPIPAARVLDTRNGTGVSGAVSGPVAAGSTITLRVGGTNGIPDYAVGIVGTVSVPDANYNGFVNVSAGDGPPDGIVAGYFTDSGPAAFQILTRLVDGKLTLWLSDNWPGAGELLLDVTAFLTP